MPLKAKIPSFNRGRNSSAIYSEAIIYVQCRLRPKFKCRLRLNVKYPSRPTCTVQSEGQSNPRMQRPNADCNLRPECRVHPKLNVETDITATNSFIYVATALLTSTAAASTIRVHAISGGVTVLRPNIQCSLGPKMEKAAYGRKCHLQPSAEMSFAAFGRKYCQKCSMQPSAK